MGDVDNAAQSLPYQMCGTAWDAWSKEYTAVHLLSPSLIYDAKTRYLHTVRFDENNKISAVQLETTLVHLVHCWTQIVNNLARVSEGLEKSAFDQHF